MKKHEYAYLLFFIYKKGSAEKCYYRQETQIHEFKAKYLGIYLSTEGLNVIQNSTTSLLGVRSKIFAYANFSAHSLDGMKLFCRCLCK